MRKNAAFSKVFVFARCFAAPAVACEASPAAAGAVSPAWVALAMAAAMTFSLAALAPISARAQGRPVRASRLDQSIMRDNRLFARNEASPGDAPKPELDKGAIGDAVLKPMADAPPMRPATKKDISRIEAIDKRYQLAKSLSMDLTKTLKISALGRERVAKGRVLVSKGRMRMEIDTPDKSLLIVDKKNAWLVNYPPEDFKGAALQVVKAGLGTKKARSMAIVGLLAQGGFLKYFSVVGVMAAPGDDQLKTIYFLQPQRELVEFTRAQARLTIDGKNIFELRYWDEIGNETSLLFSNTRLNPPLAESMFEYVPPKDADVTTI